jgi:DNA-directed RNA polymerase subunit H
MVRQHVKLKPPDIKYFLDRYQIEKHQIPKILESDAAVKAIQAKPGDVIKIVRNPDMGENGSYYRVVIKSTSRLRLVETGTIKKKTTRKAPPKKPKETTEKPVEDKPKTALSKTAEKPKKTPSKEAEKPKKTPSKTAAKPKKTPSKTAAKPKKTPSKTAAKPKKAPSKAATKSKAKTSKKSAK